VASFLYASRLHFDASNLGLGSLRKPIIPAERGSWQSSNQKPYGSGCVAGLQPGSLSDPSVFQRSSRRRESTSMSASAAPFVLMVTRRKRFSVPPVWSTHVH